MNSGDDRVDGACLCGALRFALRPEGPIDRPPQAHVFWDMHVPWLELADDLPRLGAPAGAG